MRKLKFDIALAIEMYKSGSKYKEIADVLHSSPDAIRMSLKKYAPELLELKRDKIIDLFKSGMNYKEISKLKNINVTEDAIRKLIKKYASRELKAKISAKKVDKQLFEPKEEEIILPVMGNLTVDDRKQLLNEKRWGINTNEGISNYSFFKWNQHSYIADPTDSRKYRFNEKHGSIQKDLKTLYL